MEGAYNVQQQAQQRLAQGIYTSKHRCNCCMRPVASSTHQHHLTFRMLTGFDKSAVSGVTGMLKY